MKEIPVNTTHPYSVMIQAYNPDNRNLTTTDPSRSQAVIDVYVGEEFCFVTIEPEPEDARLTQGNVTAGVEITAVTANSSCAGDIEFDITEETFKNGRLIMWSKCVQSHQNIAHVGSYVILLLRSPEQGTQ